MTFGAVISGLFALAKAVPIVNKWLESLYNAMTEKKIERFKDNKVAKYKRLKHIIELLKETKDDSERIALSVLLNDIDKL